MGEVDIKSKAYLGQPDVFADVFNYYIYDGQPVICPNICRNVTQRKLVCPMTQICPETKFRDTEIF